MNDLYIKRNIIAIDLKSFYASCECLSRNLDLSTASLVVCEPNRKGAITLAVSPYLKTKGIKGRTRVYDLPKNLNIIKAPPRMNLYKNKSIEVLNVYREFISLEDMHVYSIDEVFLDVTNYLNLYKKSAYELAICILDRIKEKTGLIAAAGVGPNIFLAKVAMDVEAKHVKDNIALWSYDDVCTKLWSITPISKVWGIGNRMEIKLNNLKLFTIGDIAKYDKNILKDKYGVIGEELWYHSNGIDLTTIKELNRPPKNQSISHSQILHKDYYHNINLIIREMIDVLTRRLRNDRKSISIVGFGISYNKEIGGGFYKRIKLDSYTKNTKDILLVCNNIFEKYYEDLPIRKVDIYLSGIRKDAGDQLSLFESYEEVKLNNKINNVTDSIKDKYGENIILPASSLLPSSTIRARNSKNFD